MASSSPRTVEEIFKDYNARRSALVRALTNDVDDFYSQCDPDKENLCLYGHPNEAWEVALPAEEVPPELPEPALGINFARDGMNRKDWLSLVAVHSDCWLLSVAFYFGARLNRNERNRLYSMINDIPTIFEVVTGRKPAKDKPTVESGSKSRNGTKRSIDGQPRSNPKLADNSYEEDEEEQGDTFCGSCRGGYNSDEFWIGCDNCERWYHGNYGKQKRCSVVTGLSFLGSQVDHFGSLETAYRPCCGMCSGSKSELMPSNFIMEGGLQELKAGAPRECSVLLEWAASDDLVAFKSEVEEKGLDFGEASYWYGRRLGSRKMGFEERTPLIIAAMFGSVEVLKYIIGSGKIDVNRACGSDGVTALHCAVAGGAGSSVEIIKLLLDASADVNCVDASGNKPVDLIASGLKALSNSRRKVIELLLNGDEVLNGEEESNKMVMPQLPKEGSEKKEYPMDASLPDINDGIYGTDDFRMYTFKVKPCSRAYSHDWTECPFVHPGENARRRDPRKYPYSCVPCPEFRKGACPKGDNCEYAHGVFESWLHPAQYRTRLCKDEIGCARKVCFFAHKPEELRPVHASTGSVMPSPRSTAVNAVDMTTLSPLALGSSSLPMPAASTPPMSPMVASSSPKPGSLWQNKISLTPPVLQLPGSRLKTASSARDFELKMELLELENKLQQQQLMDEISSLSAPSCWSKEYSRLGDLNPPNLDDAFGSLDPSLMSPLKGLPVTSGIQVQLQSSTGLQMRQNLNQLRSNYPTNLTSSPVRKPSPFGFESSAAVAAAVMNSRSSAFAKRSQSFIDRGASRAGLTMPSNSATAMSSNKSDWSSPGGKLDWGIQGDELNKLRKSASFGIRNNNLAARATIDTMPFDVDEPDVSWVHSLVKDVTPMGTPSQLQWQYGSGKGVRERLPTWVEQMYMEQQEQMVA
ncbi:hypothetical protein V6N13_062733 [Hibiscus sabdariffa]